jgi:aminoglycoside phosphotransferase (APT) family kinase protein
VAGALGGAIALFLFVEEVRIHRRIIAKSHEAMASISVPDEPEACGEHSTIGSPYLVCDREKGHAGAHRGYDTTWHWDGAF